MPSPIGHAIAGVAIGQAITPGRPRTIVACAALAAAADADLLLPSTHRTLTHGIGAVAVVTILAIVVTRKVTDARLRVVVALVTAYASHLLLDWLGADPVPPRGLQLLSPFSDRWFISDWDVFRGTTRRELATAHAWWVNATAIAQEIVILGPVAWLAFRFRRH